MASKPACAECTQRGRPCTGLYPECDYYRRSNPGPTPRPRQARIRREQEYLLGRVHELEAELERLLGTTSTPHSPVSSPTSPTSPKSISATGPPPPFGPVPSEMSGNWWTPSSLGSGVHEYLANIFFTMAPSYHIHPYIPGFRRRSASNDPRVNPSQALVNAIYLIACAATSTLGPNSPYALTHLEDHFLQRTRTLMGESLASADRLLDYFKASIILSAYLNSRGRHLEGYHHHCGATRLALACDLHRVPQPLSTFQSTSTTSGEETGRGLLPHMSHPSDAAERIYTFWNMFIQDSIYETVYGLAPALDEEAEVIQTPLPLAYTDPETISSIEENPGITLFALLNSQSKINSPSLKFPLALLVISLVLWHKVRRPLNSLETDDSALVACNNAIMDLEQVGTDLGGHLRCVQDLSHITAIEFLKTAPMSGGLNETEMLQHVHCIYEGAIETGIRNVCNIQRHCWQVAASWLQDYRETALSQQRIDEAQAADIKSKIVFFDRVIQGHDKFVKP